MRKQVFRELILAQGKTYCVKEAHEKDVTKMQDMMSAWCFVQLLAMIEGKDKNQGHIMVIVDLKLKLQSNAMLLIVAHMKQSVFFVNAIPVIVFMRSTCSTTSTTTTTAVVTTTTTTGGSSSTSPSNSPSSSLSTSKLPRTFTRLLHQWRLECSSMWMPHLLSGNLS
jgi:hypothetical protein